MREYQCIRHQPLVRSLKLPTIGELLSCEKRKSFLCTTLHKSLVQILDTIRTLHEAKQYLSSCVDSVLKTRKELGCSEICGQFRTKAAVDLILQIPSTSRLLPTTLLLCVMWLLLVYCHVIVQCLCLVSHIVCIIPDYSIVRNYPSTSSRMLNWNSWKPRIATQHSARNSLCSFPTGSGLGDANRC